MTNRVKITSLWIIFLLGMITHFILSIIPIFFGADVTMPNATGVVPPVQIWMRLFIFLIPIIVIVVTLFLEVKWYRITNFIITLLFTVINIFHLTKHAGTSPVDPRQIVLLTFVLIFGIILNIVSYRWVKE